MKKKIVFLSVLTLSLLIATGCKKNNTDVDGKKENIKGNIKETVTKVDDNNSKYPNEITILENYGNGSFYICPKYHECGVIDANGKWIVQPENDHMYNYGEGLYSFRKGSKTGFYNMEGNVAFETENIGKFSEGYALINKGNDGSKDGSYIVDKSGNKVADIANAYCRDMLKEPCVFSEGLIALNSNSSDNYNKFGYYDTKGNKVIDSKYYIVSTFNGGYAIAETFGEKFIIDKTGNEIFKSNNTIKKTVVPNVFIVEENHKEGLYDVKKGKFVVEPKYSRIEGTNKDLSFFAREGIDDKIKYYDKNGKQIVDTEFSGATDFSEGYAIVYRENNENKFSRNCGYINESGKLVIDYMFSGCEPYEGGYATVSKDGIRLVLDNNGNVVLGKVK